MAGSSDRALRPTFRARQPSCIPADPFSQSPRQARRQPLRSSSPYHAGKRSGRLCLSVTQDS